MRNFTTMVSRRRIGAGGIEIITAISTTSRVIAASAPSTSRNTDRVETPDW